MALPNPLESFVWGAGGAQMTPEEIARQREIAAALTGQGVDTSPVGDWTQGAARVVNALGGVLKERRAMGAETANSTANSDLIQKMLGGSSSAFPAAPPAAGGPAVASALSAPQTLAQGADPIQEVADAAGVPNDGSWLQYANQGATRSQPLNEKLTSALSFLPEMGVTMKVFSGGQDATGPNRTGSHRHDHGNAGDVFFYKDGKQLNWADPNDRPIFENIVRKGKAAGVTGFGAGDGYMQPGSMHLGFGTPSVWGAGGKGANAPDWLKNAYNSLEAAKAPASAAIDAVAPQQVASLDPAIGMATPAQGDGLTPGDPATSTPEGAQFLQRMMNQAPMGGSVPQMQPNQQVAQALSPQEPNLSTIPAIAGGTAGLATPSQQQGINPAIMEALSSPYASEQTKRIAGMLLGQQMDAQQQASDPMRQMQLEKAQLELEQMRNPQAQPMINAGAGAIYNPNTGEWLTAPNQGKAEQPSAVREYEYAKGQGFPGTFADWEASKKGGMSLQVDPATGAVTFQQGGNIKPMTEAQSKDTTFAVRAKGALPILDKFGDSLTNFGETAAGALPGGVGNYMQSPEYQQAQQAGTEFLQAILRKDTGAAITNEETAVYGKVYLPRPGDSAPLLEQKRVSRARALEALQAGMTPQAILAQEKALEKVKSSTTTAPDSSQQQAPEGVDPALWEAMTPEERALWN